MVEEAEFRILTDVPVLDQDSLETSIDIAVRGNLQSVRAMGRGVGDWSREESMAFQESE